MGMYDTVIVEADYPLKGLFKSDGYPDFQTKDLENLLESYTITKEGKLLRHIVHYKMKRGRRKKGLAGLVGMMNSIPMGKEEVPYNGILRFYTSYGSEEWGRFFIDYDAIFDKGQLKEIKLVKQEIF